VAKQSDLKITLTLDSWQTMRTRLENGQLDALTGVLYSAERDRVFDFSIPHLVISYAIFIRSGTPFRSVEELKNKEVIVVSGVYAHDWLLANRFTPHIFTVNRPQQALELLASGKHDVAVIPRLHGLDLLRRMNIDTIETVGPPVLSQKFCFAVIAGNADLLARLNEGLAQVQRSGEYDQIYLKWFMASRPGRPAYTIDHPLSLTVHGKRNCSSLIWGRTACGCMEPLSR
jgi:polar amino acid transport system substrate-binding protein